MNAWLGMIIMKHGENSKHFDDQAARDNSTLSLPADGPRPCWGFRGCNADRDGRRGPCTDSSEERDLFPKSSLYAALL